MSARSAGQPPVLVLGGADDAFVDADGYRETAAWCDGKLVMVPDLAHDMMLVRVPASSMALFASLHSYRSLSCRPGHAQRSRQQQWAH